MIHGTAIHILFNVTKYEYQIGHPTHTHKHTERLNTYIGHRSIALSKSFSQPGCTVGCVFTDLIWLCAFWYALFTLLETDNNSIGTIFCYSWPYSVPFRMNAPSCNVKPGNILMLLIAIRFPKYRVNGTKALHAQQHE